MIKIILCMFMGVGTCSVWAETALDRAFDSIFNIDVLPEDDPVWTTITGDYPGFAPLLNVSGDAAVMGRVTEAASNYAFSASIATNRLDKARLSVAVLLMSRYDITNSAPLFASIVARGNCEEIVSEAAFSYAAGQGVSAPTMKNSLVEDWATLESGRRAKAYEGAFRGLNSIVGSSVDTNRVVFIAMKCIEKNIAWRQGDSELCYLWPDYATSSNRYVAAQRALQTIPPPASSNYLNRVIAELEALPPGTMRMLSTNHLGQAWQE